MATNLLILKYSMNCDKNCEDEISIGLAISDYYPLWYYVLALISAIFYFIPIIGYIFVCIYIPRMVKIIDPENYKGFRCKSLINFFLLEVFMICRFVMYLIIKAEPKLWFESFWFLENKRSFEITYFLLEFMLIQYFICLKAINLKQELN